MASIRYINLDIRVIRDADGQFRIIYIYPGVEPSSGLERVYRPPDGYESLLRAGSETRGAVRGGSLGDTLDEPIGFKALAQAGDALYAALIPPETEALLSLAESVESPVRVRIRLDLTRAPELSATPWEALFRKASNKLLATTVNTTVIRLLDPDEQEQQAPITCALRVLIAVAIPRNDLAADAEIASIRGRIQALSATKPDVARLEFQELRQTNRKSLRQKVYDFKPHVIHYIGHGEFMDGRGYLLLHDEEDPGQDDWLDAGDLAALCQSDRPRLVVLNTCKGAKADLTDPFAGCAQSLIQCNVPYVVAMQAAISDGAAVTFAEEFYSVLAAGEPIDAAVSRARNAIRLMKSEAAKAELIKPVLYCSGRIEPLVAPFVATEPAVPSVPPSVPTPEPEPEPVNGGDISIRVPKIAIGAMAATALILTGGLGAMFLMRSGATYVPVDVDGAVGADAPPRYGVGSAVPARPVSTETPPAAGAGLNPRPTETAIVWRTRRGNLPAVTPPPLEPVVEPAFVDLPPEQAFANGFGWYDRGGIFADTARLAGADRWTDWGAANVVPTYGSQPSSAWTWALPEVVDGPMSAKQRDDLMLLGAALRVFQHSVEIQSGEDAAASRAAVFLGMNGVPRSAISIRLSENSNTTAAHASTMEGGWSMPAAPASHFFDTGAIDPLDAGRDLVEATAARLADWPSEVGLRVVGHTDATGAVDYNDALGIARAGAVVALLVEAGVPRERTSFVGAGARAAAFDTADAFARRADVEVVLTGAESVVLGPDGTLADVEPTLDRLATFLTMHTDAALTLRPWSRTTAPSDDEAAEHVRSALVDRGLDPARIQVAAPLSVDPTDREAAETELYRVDLILMLDPDVTSEMRSGSR